jgi:hypothetical protein
MTTNETEAQAIARGDMIAAREAFHRERAAKEEQQALYQFFRKNVDSVLNCEANSGLLLREARSYGPVTPETLEVARIAINSSLIAPNAPAPPALTAEQSRVSENRRLVALTSEQLREEIKRQKPHLRIMVDSLAPEVAALKTRADIKALSADSMRGMLNYSDGRKRHKNIAHIESVLNGTI